jgi:ADP-heptose:LPS heptosyltransferase
MRAEQFDLLLQMQGNGTIVNELLAQFGARRLAGFHNIDSRMDPCSFVEYPEHVHEIHRHQALMSGIGIPLAGDELEFPLTAKDQQEYDSLYLSLKPGHYVCIHPGSRAAWRQWPPQYFALLADQCAGQGFDIVITGTSEETDIIRELMKRMHFPAIDLTGCTTLGSMGLLLRDAAMLIANCTGVSHLAAALKTPSLIISMDGEPYRWGPLDHTIHKTIDYTSSPSLDKVLISLQQLLAMRPRPGTIFPYLQYKTIK